LVLKLLVLLKMLGNNIKHILPNGGGKMVMNTTVKKVTHSPENIKSM